MLLLCLVPVIIGACNATDNVGPISQTDHLINLRWNSAYAGETQEKVETGLLWSLSFLGAEFPSGSYDRATRWNGNTLQLNLSDIGFNQDALSAISKLVRYLKQSHEYATTGGIDIGRFIMLTLNSSNHYYAITGASTSYADVRLDRRFDSMRAAIIESSVALTNRLIEVPDSSWQSLLNTAFIAHECNGSVADGTQSVYEFETTELMTNGQFRFAIYNVKGNLLTVSDPTKTSSGKPAKCLWCHEISLQPPYVAHTSVKGYYGPDVFERIISTNMTFVDNYRKTLNGDIDFTKRGDHTLAELLYISFMEPGAERLSLEWNMSLEQVREKLKNLPTHQHSEFPFLGTLYHRKDVDPLSPYPVIEVPESAREASAYEPDLLK